MIKVATTLLKIVMLTPRRRIKSNPKTSRVGKRL